MAMPMPCAARQKSMPQNPWVIVVRAVAPENMPIPTNITDLRERWRKNIAGGEPADAQAQREDRGEQAGNRRGKGELTPDIGGDDREEIAVGGHQHVREKQNAIHRDGDRTRAGLLAGSGAYADRGYLSIVHCRFLLIAAEYTPQGKVWETMDAGCGRCACGQMSEKG